MCTQGFNLGIDFTGGTIIELRFQKEVTLADVRGVLREKMHFQFALHTAESGGSANVGNAPRERCPLRGGYLYHIDPIR